MPFFGARGHARVEASVVRGGAVGSMQYGSVPIRDRSGRADEDGLSTGTLPPVWFIVVNDLEMFLDQDVCCASTPVPPGVILSSAL